MAEIKGIKRPFIAVSSSSEEKEEENLDESEPESESVSEEGDDGRFDDVSVEEINSSTSCDVDDDDDDDDDDDGSEVSDTDDEVYESSGCENLDGGDSESICNRVIKLLRERSDLQELNLAECKAYLRKYELRLSGTKAECVERIREHWRIKDGNGVALYPRSSFTINCTGDVCKGDIVLFTQKVYKKFDKVKRRGSLFGRRTIAGRIVKESYGAARQQHTFTVEVLWSKGIKQLPPLFPLLVKGRNLYRMKTFRRPWKNEKERLAVLAEKHKRGAAARFVRALKKTRAMKKIDKPSSTNAGAKRQKQFHQARPCQKRRKSDTEKGKAKCADRQRDGTAVRSHNQSKKFNRNRQDRSKQTQKLGDSGYCRGHENFSRPDEATYLTFRPYSYHPRDSHHFLYEHKPRGASFYHSFHEAAASTRSHYTSRLPHFRPSEDSAFVPACQYQAFQHGPYLPHVSSYPICESEPRRWSHFPSSMSIHRPPHPYSWVGRERET